MKKLKKMGNNCTRDRMNSPFTVILFAILIIYTILLVTMLVWGVLTSLKSRIDWDMGNYTGLPGGAISEWGWENYATVFKNYKVMVNINGSFETRGFFQMAINSVIYSVGCALCGGIATCLVGYLVAKFDCAFSRFVYTFNLITMVIPIIGATPAMLDLMHSLKLYDTFIGIFITSFNFRGMYMLMFYGIFKGLSKEYSDAARIDGAGEFTIFFKIMFPLVRNTFSTVCLLNFITHWNEYQTVLLYLPSYPTLGFGAWSMNKNNNLGLGAEPTRLAACMMTCLPLIILFLALQDKLIGNLTMGGVKE